MFPTFSRLRTAAVATSVGVAVAVSGASDTASAATSSKKPPARAAVVQHGSPRIKHRSVQRSRKAERKVRRVVAKQRAAAMQDLNFEGCYPGFYLNDWYYVQCTFVDNRPDGWTRFYRTYALAPDWSSYWYTDGGPWIRIF